MEPVPLTIVVTLLLVFYIFGVPRVADKLELTFKSDSKIINKVLDGTRLRSLEFKTCIAGTFTHIQMFTMLLCELVYQVFYT